MKGYFDTIPKELEEAALIDGAGLFGTFIRIMIPLSLPAFAIVILFSFMNGWTEFILSWIFLTGKTDSYTLAMALATMTSGANTAPPDMQKFAAHVDPDLDPDHGAVLRLPALDRRRPGDWRREGITRGECRGVIVLAEQAKRP